MTFYFNGIKIWTWKKESVINTIKEIPDAGDMNGFILDEAEMETFAGSEDIQLGDIEEELNQMLE